MDSDSDITCELHRILDIIVTGRTHEEIHEGWEKLRKFEELLQGTSSSVDLARALRYTLNGDTYEAEYNVEELPLVLKWFAGYLPKPRRESEPLSNDVGAFLNRANVGDISQLSAILDALLEYPSVYLPESCNHKKLCKSLVSRLAECRMSHDPNGIREYMIHTRKISGFLNKVCEQAGDKPGLIHACLGELYSIVSDKKRRAPGVALCVVLELVEKGIIPQAVSYIIFNSNNDEQLVQALKVLCGWLLLYTRGDHLSLWILELMRGLESLQKFSMLLEVVKETLPNMAKTLVIPVARVNSRVVFYVLKKQGTPVLLEKIVDCLQFVLRKLEPKSECTQEVVNVVQALMTRFPDNPVFDNIKNNLPLAPDLNEVHKILKEKPLWRDSEEMDRAKPEIPYKSNTGKVGLINLGNTCYMNSVLQALAMTRQFCQEVLNYKPSTESGEQQLILQKLQNLFALLLHSQRVFLAPTEILQACPPAYFMPGQQQDSSEFLCHLLDVLHEQEKSVLKEAIKLKAEDQTEIDEGGEAMESGAGIKRWTTEENLAEGASFPWKTQSLADFTQGEDLAQSQQLSDSHSDSTDSGIQSVGGEETSNLPTTSTSASSPSAVSSLVHRVFGGEMKITYQCAQCDTSSHNTDKFRDLQLCFPEEILEHQEVTVQDLINYYFTPEKLTGDNKYRCDKCTKLCDAQRIIKILQPPNHLILTLKHFRYDSESRLRTKLRHKVTYNESVQLSTLSYNAPETYELYAAVVHSGYSMDYGHYFTYACDSRRNWYKFNDTYVSNTTLEDFKRLEPPDTPYILFYRKSGVINEQIYEDERPETASLHKHLQDLITSDIQSYANELKQENERKRTQVDRYSSNTFRRRYNRDDDNPPPSSCRGNGGISSNHMLF